MVKYRTHRTVMLAGNLSRIRIRGDNSALKELRDNDGRRCIET